MQGDVKIRVLVVDDSLVIQRLIERGLADDSVIEICGFAADPFEARDKILDLEPDVLLLDINMPKMDGIAFLRKLMPQYPMPVIVMSSQVTWKKDAIAAGAKDFVSKKSIASLADSSVFVQEIKQKIRSVLISGKKAAARAARQAQGDAAPQTKHESFKNKIIAIGASTGGTEATVSILRQLPADMPGMLIVQHMPENFTRMYAERLNSILPHEVLEASDGDAVIPGRILVAAGQHHMQLEDDHGTYRVKVFKGEKVNAHCPSIDVLFYSVGEVCRQNAMGILLTGMGTDGAQGLLHMRKMGAYTVAQDEASSVVYGMPKAAMQIGAAVAQGSLGHIVELVCRWLEKNK